MELSSGGRGQGLLKVKIIAVLPRPQHQLSLEVVAVFVERPCGRYQHRKGLEVLPCGCPTENDPAPSMEGLSTGRCFLLSLMRYLWVGNSPNAQGRGWLGDLHIY